jgi:hypothetical protein
MIKGLVWHGSEVEDDFPEKYKRGGSQRSRASHVNSHGHGLGSRHTNGNGNGHGHGQGHASGSRSPTQSTLVSPISSSTRKHLPNTPARSVLEEFAELASLAEKTPAAKARSLPGEVVAPAPAFALANLCNSFADNTGTGTGTGAADHGYSLHPNHPNSRKRKASNTSSHHLDPRRRATTPDKLQDLIAAAEAVEGSPINSLLGPRDRHGMSHGHKRRRTIGGGGEGAIREALTPRKQRGSLRASGGTLSPLLNSKLDLLPFYQSEGADTRHVDMLVPLNDAGSSPDGMGMGAGHMDMVMDEDEDAVSTLTPSKRVSNKDVPSRDLTSSTSSTSSISHVIPSAPLASGSGPGSGYVTKLDSPTPQSQYPPAYSQTYGNGQSGSGLLLTRTNLHGDHDFDADAEVDLDANPLDASQSTSISMNGTSGNGAGNGTGAGGGGKQAKRKINELPTTGLAPGVDCKPPYPYHEMIRHAIENSQEGKLQLSQIYSSIAERFPFFASLDSQKTAGWQNSIRHNLSLK